MTDKLARLEPQVRTLARPTAGPLLAARHTIQRNPEAQALFRRAREEAWSAEQLAEKLQPLLQEQIEGTAAQVAASAQYLADEYLQIGDSVLLISTTTGKALARVTDEDIWQPGPVAREGGRMATPLPRLRPELEGFLVEWVFTQGREEILTASLTRRTPQTDLLRQEGDRRLLPVTRGGRKHLVEQLQDALPTLLGECQGLTKAFLSHFEMRTEDPTSGLEPLFRCVALAKTLTPVMDPTTFNLRHDHFTSLSARIPSQWVREFALTFALAAHQHGSVQPISHRSMNPEVLSSAQLWVAEPNTVQALYSKDPTVSALPVEGAPTIGLDGVVGAIVIDPASYACGSREFHDRWEVAAKVEYVLWVDWERVRTLNLNGILPSGLAVEVLDRAR